MKIFVMNRLILRVYLKFGNPDKYHHLYGIHILLMITVNIIFYVMKTQLKM